jgi:ABC-type Co2+ transport system permease subunit
MTHSTRIAGLLGPTLIAVAITEWLNLDVFMAATGPSYGPHVYQNGTLLFVAGLAIVRAHNLWSREWPVLITLVGWFALLAGLGRMVAPLAAQAAGESPVFLYGSLVILLAIGLVLSFKSYVRSEV